MNIIYPSLVEESFNFQRSEQKQGYFSKAEIYRGMVESGIISENCAPTDYAIEQGLVKEFAETADLSLKAFLEIYPVFEKYDLQLLQKIDGFWEIPVRLKEMLLQDMEGHRFTYDECIQILEYLADR